MIRRLVVFDILDLLAILGSVVYFMVAFGEESVTHFMIGLYAVILLQFYILYSTAQAVMVMLSIGLSDDAIEYLGIRPLCRAKEWYDEHGALGIISRAKLYINLGIFLFITINYLT